MSLKDEVFQYRKLWRNKHEGHELLHQLDSGEDVTSRQNWNGHVTASALVLRMPQEQVLMIYSTKFNRLLLAGGHVESGESTRAAALRELAEETSFEVDERLVTGSSNLPIHINTHWIEANVGRGEPRHKHHDFIHVFCLVNAQDVAFRPSEEVASTAWLPVSALRENYAVALERLTRKGRELYVD